LFDRRRYKADLVGIDPDSDLAVLKIQAENLIPATWGDSDSLEVGSMVWAVGSPYEFQQTITSGILSGKNRRGDAYHAKQTLLQTDAAVNPGNSGGPLVNVQGQVIGINTSIFGKTFQGISFAVPSSTARFVFDQLVDDNVVTRGYLGVFPAEVSERFAKEFRLPDLEGAVVDRVQPGSPAHLAGIRRGDVVRRWNGKPVRNFRQLFRFSEASEPGTQVRVDLWRPTDKGDLKLEESVTVTIQALPQIAPRRPSKFTREH